MKIVNKLKSYIEKINFNKKRYKWGFLILTLCVVVILSFDLGRAINASLLEPIYNTNAGNITLNQMLKMADENHGGKLILLNVGAKYQDAKGNLYFVNDIKTNITPLDIQNIKHDKVEIDGNLNFYYQNSKLQNKDMLLSKFLQTFFNVVLILFYIFMFRIMYKQMGGRSKKFSIIETDTVKSTFNDVAGHDSAKNELKQMVDFMRNPEKYKDMGAKPPRGVILYGPPGNGKTLLARAIAGETGSAFLEQSASSFVDKYVGEGASSVRALFNKARTLEPCVIFIDEIDAIGGNRDSGHEERVQTLNQLLTELDGFKQLDRILVIAATNRMDTLDVGLTRDGRLGKHIHISQPSKVDRKLIIDVLLKKVPNHNIDSKVWAERTSGFSGANLEGLINGAVFNAVRDNDKIVEDKHVSESRDRVLVGLRDSRVLNEKTQNIVAYHELGHAIISILFGYPVEKITIEPRGSALGLTLINQDEDELLETEYDVRAKLSYMMGGRAAESIFIGDITGGAVNDMEVASDKARKAIKLFGFSGSPYVPKHEHFDKDLEEKAKLWVENAYLVSIEVLKKYSHEMEILKAILIKEQTIDGFIVKEVLEKSPSYVDYSNINEMKKVFNIEK